MKTLRTIQYILFAFLIIGFFANFAQDSYSMEIIASATLFLALVSLIMVFIYIKKIWKHKKSSLAFFMLFVLSIILLIFFGDSSMGESILWTMFGLLIIELIWIIIENWKKAQSTNRFLAMEKGGIFLLLAGYAFKIQHYPGANFMLIFSLFIFLFLYLFKAFKLLFSEWKNGKNIAILSFLLYIYLAVVIIAWIFKTQHFPGAKIIKDYPPALLIFLLIPLSLNIKFRYATDKLSFANYLKKGSPIFLFIYITVIGLINYIQFLNVGPKMISNFPPVYQKMSDGTYKKGKMETRIVTFNMEKNDGKNSITQETTNDYGEMQQAYWDNYNEFINNRWRTSIKQ
jgi:hypothetical protein